jgi:hypothetical protein
MNIEDMRQQARIFLHQLSENSPAECSRSADALLSFLYQLDDRVKKARSLRTNIPASTTASLPFILNGLESDPDVFFQDDTNVRLLMQLLKAIAA